MSNAQPEHALQVRINAWVREHVPHPHFFCGIDRAQKHGQWEHVRQKARGLVSGMADTILIMPALPPIAVELKAPGNKPTERQTQVGTAIQNAGGIWGWCDSVAGYAAILRVAGVPLMMSADLAAQHSDAVLASAAIRREEGKTGKVSKARAPKPTPARLRRVNAVRQKVMF